MRVLIVRSFGSAGDFGERDGNMPNIEVQQQHAEYAQRVEQLLNEHLLSEQAYLVQLRGYYSGQCPHPDDTYRPITEWNQNDE